MGLARFGPLSPHIRFYIIEGDLIDHDGTKYGPGDLVWLRKGTEHTSYSPNGCLIVVYLV